MLDEVLRERTVAEDMSAQLQHNCTPQVNVDQWIAAVYDEQWYPGNMLCIVYAFPEIKTATGHKAK